MTPSSPPLPDALACGAFGGASVLVSSVLLVVTFRTRAPVTVVLAVKLLVLFVSDFPLVLLLVDASLSTVTVEVVSVVIAVVLKSSVVNVGVGRGTVKLQSSVRNKRI